MPLSGLTAYMHTGVDFFFVLSGYIIVVVHRADIGQPVALRPVPSYPNLARYLIIRQTDAASSSTAMALWA